MKLKSLLSIVLAVMILGVCAVASVTASDAVTDSSVSSIIHSRAKPRYKGTNGTPDAVTRPPITEEESQKIQARKNAMAAAMRDQQLQQEQIGAQNGLNTVSSEGPDPLEIQVIYSEHYLNMMNQHDQQAISALNRITGSEYEFIEAASEEYNQTVCRAMLDQLKTGQLTYEDRRVMILYIVRREADLSDEFIYEAENHLAQYVNNDPQLIEDIEVTCDPMFYGPGSSWPKPDLPEGAVE